MGRAAVDNGGLKRGNIEKMFVALGLEPIERHFSFFLGRLAVSKTMEVMLAAAEVSRATNNGNVCVDLTELAGSPIGCSADGEQYLYPDLDDWLHALLDSGVVGRQGERFPMVLDSCGRLYLHRYWQYQRDVGQFILKNIAKSSRVEIDGDLLADGLCRLFAPNEKGGVDWQAVAAFAAVRSRFSVISGGPGTGKTTVVARVLVLLIEQARGAKIRIALAAPTGKAVSRLQESIRLARPHIDCAPEVLAQIPDAALTLHRLLGVSNESGVFRYNAINLLPFDVIVIDEASMVDLPMMARLVRAVKDGGRLILVGDRGQLSSVEPGAVLGDICRSEALEQFSAEFCHDLKKAAGVDLSPSDKAKAVTLHDSIVELKRNYRFGNESGIRQLSDLISGEVCMGAGLAGFFDGGNANCLWRDFETRVQLEKLIEEVAGHDYRDLMAAASPLEALATLGRFQVLCALRRGPFGVDEINALIEKKFVDKGLIPPGRVNYRGRPIMVVRNDYGLHLYNGDVGIFWPDEENGGELRAFFSAEGGGLRSFPLLILPAHETVYAMTVHKSQGSEYDKVVVILPDREVPVLARELLYTALTRAKSRVEIWGDQQVFAAALSRRIKRVSGLSDMLWGHGGMPEKEPCD